MWNFRNASLFSVLYAILKKTKIEISAYYKACFLLTPLPRKSFSPNLNLRKHYVEILI